MASPDSKSDIIAKLKYKEYLLRQGYTNVRVVRGPADIAASKDGADWKFEIKFTRKEKSYFGAATLTEWAEARANPDYFRFVIAFEANGNWVFHEYTVREFMAFSYVPPFKIFFHAPLDRNTEVALTRARTRVALTDERLIAMEKLYAEFKAPGKSLG